MHKVVKLKEIKPELEGPPTDGGKSEIIFRLVWIFRLSLRAQLQSAMKSIFPRRF